MGEQLYSYEALILDSAYDLLQIMVDGCNSTIGYLEKLPFRQITVLLRK